MDLAKYFMSNKIKMARQGSKSVEVLHFYYLRRGLGLKDKVLTRRVLSFADINPIKIKGTLC